MVGVISPLPLVVSLSLFNSISTFSIVFQHFLVAFKQLSIRRLFQIIYICILQRIELLFTNS